MKVVSKENLSDEIVLRVLKKQIDLLYHNQVYAILMTVFAFVLMLTLLMPIANWDQHQYIIIILMSSMLMRMVSSWLYYRDKKQNTVDLKRSQLFYLIGIVSTAIFWSILSIELFPVLDFRGQLLLFLVVTGFATGAYTTMGYMKEPVFFFVTITFISLSIAIYRSDIPGAQDVVIGTILYMLVIIRSAFVFYNNTYSMLSFQELSIDRENELLLQREKANTANYTKSEFMSRMSHELRTPLNAILGLSELQIRDKQHPLTKKQSSRAQKIGEAGKHLLAVVNDVLDLSRIETGSMEIKLEATDLCDVIEHSIELVETKASLRKIVVSSDIDQYEFGVMADKNRLKQIVVNLLDNAIKYNKLGGNVSINANYVENNHVRLNIVDTGQGLLREELYELFVPFSRLGAEGKGIDGTGIGLSLCKELVELMDGSIGVDSRPGEGSCFWIELPYVAIENTSKAFSSMEMLHFKKLSAEKVLLVEDNIVNSEVAVDILDTMGIRADVAADGEQAIELFKANQYSLILMDCEMPVMDGFTTTKQIRKIERELQHASIPIIALTAHAISGTREKCIASGMDGFLSKPFSMSDLYSTIAMWSDHVKTTESSHSVPDTIDDANLINIRCDSTVLDSSILLKLYVRQQSSNSNLVNKVISIYLEQSSNLLSELYEAYQASDIESIRVAAHTLKSSSVNVGALGFSELCRAIELSSEQGTIDQSMMQKVYSNYADVEKALKDVLLNISKSS